jgi:serine/threonine-protein kinase
MNDNTPTRMGDYEVLGVLGAGGMGRVYKVRNVITDRVEAMKVLLPELEGHEEVAARFLREIKLLAALRHQNIAALLTALTVNNQLVMLMEFVEGTSLASLLSQGPIPPGEALNYIDQALDALSYAHQQGIVHRDIKPANMMLTVDCVVKLMDFGIARAGGSEPAKLTQTGSTLGSISYMSPEQVKGANVDHRSDLYSVGISLYEMVTGEKPFHGESSFSIMAAHINEMPRPPVELRPELPEGLNEIILTAIAKTPEQRFQSADAFRNAVRAVQRNVQESKTIIQGSQNTVIAGAARGAPTGPITVQRTPTPTPARVTPPKPVPAFGQPAAAAPAPVMQPAAPQAPAQAAPPPQASSHRGLYMGLGAFIVLVVLVTAGIYLPGRGKSSVSAEEGSPPAATQPAASQPAAQPTTSTATPAEPSTAQPAGLTAAAPSGSGNTAAKPAALPVKKALAPSQPADNGAAAAAARAAEDAARAELAAIEDDVDKLTIRAAAVNSSLEQLQRRQAQAGYGLRGDMAAKQASMNLNLAKAQDAIQRRDPERARRAAEQAGRDIEALERFLGR